MDLIYWFLPGITLLGILTTYTDLKQGKIRNKHIVLALAYSLIAYAIIASLNWGTIRPGYFIEILIMCALSMLTGFILWHAGLWTAGDAKLFLAYSALVPLSTYKYGHIPYFGSTNILINTFIPMFLFLSVTLLFKTSLKQKLFFLKKSFVPRQILTIAVFLFSFTWVIKILFNFTKIPADYFMIILILFITMTLFEKITSINLLSITIIISILRVILDRSILSYGFLTEFLIILASFAILRFFILYLGFYFLTKEIDIKLLKPGMIPAELVYKDKNSYKKQELLFYSLFGYLEEKIKKRCYLIEPTPDGLTEEEVKKLKSLEKKLRFEHIRIQQTIPFAPYMFSGVLLTVIFKGNIFITLLFFLK